MAINPYQISEAQKGLTEELLSSQQKMKTMQAATTGQMSKMEEKFQKEMLLAQQKAEAQLRKKNKGGMLGKLLSFISPFAGPIAGPILSGLISGIQTRRQGGFARRQAELAKSAALGVDTKRFGGTFLGKRAREYEAKQESLFDKMISETDLGFGDIFKAALGSGVMSMAMGKATRGIGDKIGDIRAEKALLKGAEKGVKAADISAASEALTGASPALTKETILDYTTGGGKDVSKLGGTFDEQINMADILDDLNISDPEQLERLLRVSGSGDVGVGPLKRLFGEGSPFQEGVGLEKGQASLLTNLLLGLGQSQFLE
jgi:hypothetical protein